MSDKNKTHVYDAIGIGIGAFNLSLAALLKKSDGIKYQFFDQKDKFDWHPGMLLENAKLQVHFLKDLASCVDPSNPYTFLSYLAENNRIYPFLNRKRNTISRHEFNDYFQWASKRIAGLTFGKKITEMQYHSGKFKVLAGQESFSSNHIIIGTGIKPYIPKHLIKFIGNNFFHNHEFKKRICQLSLAKKRVAVIGGGQSGAEIFDTLLSQQDGPREIIWVSKQQNFQALEDSSFTNEFYTPDYIDYFYKLPKHLREKKLSLQRFTSDGITQEFADEIYNKLYEIKYLNTKNLKFKLASNHILTDAKKHGDEYHITLYNKDLDTFIDHTVDIVILATGYQSNVIEHLNNILPNIQHISDLVIKPDYSIDWANGKTNKIFVQNGAKHTHGIADPNLSLASWRNAVIVNSLSRKKIYNTVHRNSILIKSESNRTARTTSIEQPKPIPGRPSKNEILINL